MKVPSLSDDLSLVKDSDTGRLVILWLSWAIAEYDRESDSWTELFGNGKTKSYIVAPWEESDPRSDTSLERALKSIPDSLERRLYKALSHS